MREELVIKLGDLESLQKRYVNIPLRQEKYANVPLLNNPNSQQQIKEMSKDFIEEYQQNKQEKVTQQASVSVIKETTRIKELIVNYLKTHQNQAKYIELYNQFGHYGMFDASLQGLISNGIIIKLYKNADDLYCSFELKNLLPNPSQEVLKTIDKLSEISVETIQQKSNLSLDKLKHILVNLSVEGKITLEINYKNFAKSTVKIIQS
jgi:hypothetical protein